MWSAVLTSSGVYITFNVIYNYVMAIYVGPGHPYATDYFDPCKKCEMPKPPRSHH